ncbi:MAG: hypothetical protein BVN29_18490 [Nitrospira sp. ST-bin5]|nr:MAG: hypothetical protein BVN29_18490 [Nitrospira sp. ST-bin5]
MTQWGEPLSKKETSFRDENSYITKDGEEFLWLWKPDGTGPSDKQGDGWELFLAFNEKGIVRNWRVGSYQTSLTIADVVRACRIVRASILDELGLAAHQHGIVNGPRQFQLGKLQLVVFQIWDATTEADAAALSLYGRLATQSEIVGLMEARAAEVRVRQEAQRRLARRYADNDYGRMPSNMFGGLLGNGFMGPYTPNAYGPGMNSDATGRPFIWKPDFGGPALGPINPNAYGPGIGMDGTGRPVRPACPPGWAGPC